MCGIAGVVQFDDESVTASLIEKMTKRVAHRGPDGCGVRIFDSHGLPCQGPGSVGMGHRRLAVIDLSREADQPMTNERATVWITFNGEIYNFREIRDELEARGHIFKSKSDTEVILHLYEEFGPKCVERLNGMFAFAIWDSERQKLFCARDRLGIKPLYYHWDGRAFVFGSEIACLTEYPDFKPEVDRSAIRDYLTYHYVPGERTVLRGACKLLPGHVLVLHKGRLTTSRYWGAQDDAGEESVSPDTEDLPEVIRDAVKMQLVSDVPLGAFLSGGIDSSVLVALMSEVSDRPIRTFSVGFEETAFSELIHARSVAEHFGTEHTEYVVRPDATELLPLIVASCGEPFADASALPMYCLAQCASQEVKVCLSGDGGDEVFAGYDRYRRWLRYRQLDFLPERIRRPFCSTLGSLLPGNARGKGLLERLSMAGIEQYGALLHPQMTSGDRPLLRREFYAEEDRFAYLGKIAGEKSHLGLTDLQLLDVQTYLPDDVLVKVDRMTMAHSLEVRVPLLDHRVVKCGLRLPDSKKVSHRWGKIWLRKTFAHMLPKDITWRRKMGFGLPIRIWFRGALRSYARDHLLGRSSFSREFLEPKTVQWILDSHDLGRRDFSATIWSLLVLELWFRQHRADATKLL